MKIATYNVNGIRARLPLLLRWLEEQLPDIVCLQELKAPQEQFPAAALHDAGYGAVWHGQKSWNGVAILGKGCDPVERRRALAGDPDDVQSRYLEAEVGGMVIGCLYLPNGNPAPGPKFDYKLRWFQRLADHARDLLDSGMPVALAGDFNVIPEELDVYAPDRWVDDALFRPEVRAASGRARLHVLEVPAQRVCARCRAADRPHSAESRRSTGPSIGRRGPGCARLGTHQRSRADLGQARRNQGAAGKSALTRVFRAPFFQIDCLRLLLVPMRESMSSAAPAIDSTQRGLVVGIVITT